MLKRILTSFTIPVLLIIVMISSYGAIDNDILSDDIENEYIARDEAPNVINNLNFSDVSSTHWANESITRLGAINIIKGYNVGNRKEYRPNDPVSNQEALAFLLRAIGREDEAQLAADQINADAGTQDPILTLWSKGYLQVASQLGLITADDLGDALTEDQTFLDEEENFIRANPATREQVARWIVDAINVQNPGSINPIYNEQAIFGYDDWEDISLEFVPYVEAVSQKKIMVGDGSSFAPKKSVTRAEMAQILKNLDEILYDTMNLDRKIGTVAYIEDITKVDAIVSTASRNFLIRNNEGKVDKITYDYERNSIQQIFENDVPVYRNGHVTGLLALREGDYIEYIIDNNTNEVLYIYSKGNNEPTKLSGTLEKLSGFDDGEITIKSNRGIKFTYKMVDGLYDVDNSTININGITYPITSAPVTNTVTLIILNDVVTNISYEGGIKLSNEISGIVVDNNSDFSYITITDWDGNDITKYYKKSNIIVEKQNYYDEEDEIGYIDEIFPNYDFDERDSTIEDIEAGDIVHIKLDPTNSKYITNISAKTNYIVKFGTVKEIVDYGAAGIKLRIEYNDLSTSFYEIKDDIPVMKDNINIGKNSLYEGDVVKLLINQAVLEPGTVTETIKEIEIDKYGNNVSNVYKGNLGTINDSQRTVSLLNAFKLSKSGWVEYNQVKLLNINNKNIQYYKDGNRISLSYADKYLRQEDMEVYVAMEQYYNDEKVTKITFRDGRDSVLDYSNITYINGMDELTLLDEANPIKLDEGTIIIKNGKMVSVGSILSPDYVQVVLNGNNRAAIINVEPEPNNNAISVFRGRIANIEDNESFSVQSHAVLKDMNWIYSPIPRVFTIDYSTIIINENGIVPLDEFIGYSDISKIDEVYSIIAEGTKAKYIVKNVYPEQGLIGNIYEINDDNLMINDALVYDSSTKVWSDLSYTNSYAQVDLLTNSIIIKNNKVITKDMLEIGDKIRVMTTEYLADKLKLTGERNVNGYIIFVEK